MPRMTIHNLQQMKESGQRIVMLTAYDASSARIAEDAGVPVLLVGDSLGMVVQGHDSTVPVTMEHMIYHCEIVARVTSQPLVVGDLPFMSASISVEQALSNAARLMQASGIGAVKLEGGAFMAETIHRVTQAGIPVMAHIGLTPQSVNQFGGFRVQGRNADTARQLVRDALAVQAAGAFALVLELVPASLAAFISRTLRIPTIGIGAGAGCDGQVQVYHDILTLAGEFLPRHATHFIDGKTRFTEAVRQYVAAVQDGSFPSNEHTFSMDVDVIDRLRNEFGSESETSE